MKRTYVILASVRPTATAPATVASAQPSAHASRAAVVSLRHTSLGKVLVNSSGRTLYEFTRDRSGKDSCMSISGCPAIWPPLKSTGKPLAGSGVRASLLSTINLPGGVHQRIYAGHPLYLYSGDSGPGEASYVGALAFGGAWDAVSSRRSAVK